MPSPFAKSPSLSPVRWGIPDAVLVWIIGFFAALAGLLLMIAVASTTGKVPASGIPRDFEIPNLLMGITSQNLAIIGALAAIARVKGRGSLRLDFGFAIRVRDIGWIAIGVLISVTAGLVLLPITELANLKGSSQEVVKQFERAQGLEIPLFIIGVVVLAPIAEELLFRGILLRSFMRRTSAGWAVMISALVFALVHVAGDPGTYYYLPAFMALGLVSGYRAVRTGSLSQSISLHIGFNLLASLLIISG